jgi:hypothetical protein
VYDRVCRFDGIAFVRVRANGRVGVSRCSSGVFLAGVHSAYKAALDRVLNQFGIGFETEDLHHFVLVESHRPWF